MRDHVRRVNRALIRKGRGDQLEPLLQFAGRGTQRSFLRTVRDRHFLLERDFDADIDDQVIFIASAP